MAESGLALAPDEGSRAEPEVEAFTDFLGQLFGMLATSQTRYAARCHRDKGTVSRYLSGERIAPQDFVDTLLQHVAEITGQGVTEQVQEQARRLRLEALRARNAPGYELEVLRERLSAAEEELHRAKVLERVLLEAVAKQEERAARAEQKHRQLESELLHADQQTAQLASCDTAEDGTSSLDEQLAALQRELEHLHRELDRAQRLKRLAEQKCQRLEEQLLASEAHLATQHPRTGENPVARPELESRYSALLREVSERIGTTPDLDTTMREVCTVPIPDVADAACLHLHPDFLTNNTPVAPWKSGTTLVRVASAVSDALTEWAPLLPDHKEVVACPADGEAGDDLRPGTPILVPRISPTTAAESAAVLGDAQLVAWFSGCSLLGLPLTVHGTSVGLLILIRSPRQQPFDDTDTVRLRDLAGRAALSLDIARLHRAQAQFGVALQRSMLPLSPPRIPGAQIAYDYRAAGHTAGVGGDWFDAVRLPGNRVALVVGDVMGHGPASAAAMGRFRASMQSLAMLDMPPDQMLLMMDGLVQRLGDDWMATCLFVVYDPVARTCTIASAGSLPPVLIPPQGPARSLDAPTDRPVGLGLMVPFQVTRVHVADGSTLVMCSDSILGLREATEGLSEDGLAALCDRIVDEQRSPQDTCQTLLETLHTGASRDDLAVLVARLDGIPENDVATWQLNVDRQAARRARQLVRGQLAHWGLHELADAAELAVSELVTLAVYVANSGIGLRMLRLDRLLVEVTDDAPDVPLPDPDRPIIQSVLDDAPHLGLHIVSVLASAWGTGRRPNGKTTWFELTLPSPP